MFALHCTAGPYTEHRGFPTWLLAGATTAGQALHRTCRSLATCSLQLATNTLRHAHPLPAAALCSFALVCCGTAADGGRLHGPRWLAGGMRAVLMLVCCLAILVSHRLGTKPPVVCARNVTVRGPVKARSCGGSPFLAAIWWGVNPAWSRRRAPQLPSGGESTPPGRGVGLGEGASGPRQVPAVDPALLTWRHVSSLVRRGTHSAGQRCWIGNVPATCSGGG